MLRTIWMGVGLCMLAAFGHAHTGQRVLQFEIFGDTVTVPLPASMEVPFYGPLSAEALQAFHAAVQQSNFYPTVDALQAYSRSKGLNDWLYYQLVRQTAQRIAPKQTNYYRYTLYKWFLMVKSGYDATLNIYNDQLLFYIYSTDEVFNLPLYHKNGKQYVCLNIHDYARAAQQQTYFVHQVALPEVAAQRSFSYKVSQLPAFSPAQYTEKNVQFPYRNRMFHFSLKVNPELGAMFTNYPTLNFGDYFNIPVSHTTYESLVPALRKNLRGKSVKKGVDYLMQFTRYAFLYEDDQANFGKEKRMSPEETLLSAASDCDDRAALFFYLVKEIYNLPMIALVYPGHITIAVGFDKPVGHTIAFEGRQYSICEPTPQGNARFGPGQAPAKYRHMPYEVVYAYKPH